MEDEKKIIESICKTKIKLAKQVSLSTKEMSVAIEPEQIEKLLDQRGKAIKSLENYDKKIKQYLRTCEQHTLDFPDSFRKEFRGIMMSIFHNNEQIYRKQRMLKDDLAKKLNFSDRKRFVSKYLNTPVH